MMGEQRSSKTPSPAVQMEKATSSLSAGMKVETAERDQAFLR